MRKHIAWMSHPGIKYSLKTVVATAAVLFINATVGATVKTADPGRAMNSFPGGTWDFNNTVFWTEDGYQTRGPWTSNDDVAVIELFTNSWGSVEILIDDSLGDIGAAGLVVTNDLKAWHHTELRGAPLTLGAEGITILSENPNSFININVPLILSTGQTWRNANASVNNSHGIVVVKNVLSSEAGRETPIVFDGFGLVEPGKNNKSNDSRPGYGLTCTNTFRGSTTISGGAVLFLSFSQNTLGPRIDTQSPLFMNSGTLAVTGNTTGYTQSVASVVLQAGANHLAAFDANGTFMCNTVTRDGVGGTLDATANWNGGITFYCSNENNNRIIAGWFTTASSFAAVGETGVIGNFGGSQRWETDAWDTGTTIAIYGGGTRTLGDVSPYALRFGAAAVTNDLADAVVTVQSGAILNGVDGSCLTGGRFRSGMETGELFIHAFTPLRIESVIEDNAATPAILVKGGTAVLTLTGANTYTGATYLNSGTLALEGDASITGDCHQAGGTTLSLATGGRLASLPGGRTLGGNLHLGPGAVLDLADDAPLTLENPWGAFSTDAFANDPVLLNVTFAERNAIRRGDIIRLVQWHPGTTLSGVSVDAFLPTLPNLVDGELAVAADGLDLVITQVPLAGTRFILR